MKKLKCTMKPNELREGDMFWYELEDDLRVFDEGYFWGKFYDRWIKMSASENGFFPKEEPLYQTEYEFIGNIKEA